MSILAAGEGEERLEQTFLPLAGGGDAGAHLPQGGRVCVRVSERGLRKRELEGYLAAQLVSGVGDEAPFRFGEVPGGGRRQRPTAPFRAREPWVCGQLRAFAGVGRDLRRSLINAG